MRVGPAVRAVGVGVGGDRLRQVRLGGLEQSSNGKCAVQVGGIKASGLENPADARRNPSRSAAGLL